MSDTDYDDEDISEDVKLPDELHVLKDRARLMGITHSNNISVETLRAKIAAKQAEQEQPLDQGSSEDAVQRINPLEDGDKPARKLTIREKLLRDEMRLLRCRVTNLDPKKKDLPGEIYTVANEYIGTVRKYVPFGEHTEEGWHIPYCIYTMLKEKQFLNIRSTKGPNGQPVVRTGMSQEFSIDILPALTRDDLEKLGTAQKAAGLLDSQDEQL